MHWKQDCPKRYYSFGKSIGQLNILKGRKWLESKIAFLDATKDLFQCEKKQIQQCLHSTEK